MDTTKIELIFNGKNFRIDQGEVELEIIRNVFGFSDGNFALVDKDNVIIRKQQPNSYFLPFERSPYQIVRSGSTSTRTIVPQAPLAFPIRVNHPSANQRGKRVFFHPYSQIPALGQNPNNNPAVVDDDEEFITERQKRVFNFTMTGRKPNSIAPDRSQSGRVLRVLLNKKDATLKNLKKALKEKYSDINGHSICDKAGVEIESDEVTESTHFWNKRLPQLYYLPTRLGEKKMLRDVKNLINSETNCTVCFTNNTHYLVCMHCGNNACCITCGEKLFEDVEPNFLDVKVVNCPRCGKNWKRKGNEWKKHAINRPYKTLIEGLSKIMDEDESIENRELLAHNERDMSTPRRVVGRDVGSPSTNTGPSTSVVRRQFSNQYTPSQNRRRIADVSSPNVHDEVVVIDDANLNTFHPFLADHF